MIDPNQEFTSPARLSQSELEILICRYLNAECDGGCVRLLNLELNAHIEARDTFVRFARLHGMLLEDALTASGRESMKKEVFNGPLLPSDSLHDAMILPAIKEMDTAAPARPTEYADEPPSIPLSPPTRLRLKFPYLADRLSRRWHWAALFLLGLIAAWFFGLRRSNPSGVATLQATAHDQWGGRDGALRIGDRLALGPLFLNRGLAQITLDSGVRLVVDGPARFRIDSAMAINIDLGRATITVPAEARGFTVRTPSATAVDLGTEFGVEVDESGATQTSVIRGTVQLSPIHAATGARLIADQAAAVDAQGLGMRRIPARGAEFVESVPAIDLVDVVAGGDGTERRRDAGINADGSVDTDSPDRRIQDSKPHAIATSDGRFHRCPGRTMVAGIFIPRGVYQPDQLDPDEHRFSFPKTDGHSCQFVWAGSHPPLAAPYLPDPAKFAATDYSGAGHGMILMHANKGLTFDLRAMHAAHPDRPFARFKTTCLNATCKASPHQGYPVSARSEFWVFVDGALRFHKSNLPRTDPPCMIDIGLEHKSHYLTLVATDGGDSHQLDPVTLGDPILD